MKKIESSENQIVFTTDMNETIANSIRRYLNHVLVLAIDEVEISRNDSPLYDETIAHRMGLLPLKTDKQVNVKSTGKLKINVSRDGTVYSGDLNGKIEVVYKNVPLTTLYKGQELDIVADIKSGYGFEHSKFSPGLMFYRNVSEITLDKELYDDIKNICKEDQIKEKGNKIIVTDNQKNEIADVCEGISNRMKKKVEITEGNGLVITLESFGQMPVEEIFRKSIDSLKRDLTSLHKFIDKA